jgi:hypothetical protein
VDDCSTVDETGRLGDFSPMSANEIIAELPHLAADELMLIKDKVDQVLKDRGAATPPGVDSFFSACLDAAKLAPETPPDFSENIDAYLYGGKALPRV